MSMCVALVTQAVRSVGCVTCNVVPRPCSCGPGDSSCVGCVTCNVVPRPCSCGPGDSGCVGCVTCNVVPRPCSCGPGDSGCTECGVCRACAGDPQENEKGGGAAIVDMANGGLLEVLARSRDLAPLDPLIGEFCLHW